MTVELANHFYGFGDDLKGIKSIQQKESFSDLRDRLRIVVFDNVAKSYLPGLIFTGAMYYDSEAVWQIMNSYIDTFKKSARSKGEETRLLVVELTCDLDERLKRNVSENRILKKPSKKTLNGVKKILKLKYKQEE